MDNLIQRIERYTSTRDFDDLLSLEEGCVFFVDWREFDDAIVEYCENILKTGHLTAEIQQEDELVVTYKNKQYQQQITDSRDPSIKFVNSILLPDYEIRFCTETFPSDTLGFIVLSCSGWQEIEALIDKELLDKLFEPIDNDSKMFDRDFDF